MLSSKIKRAVIDRAFSVLTAICVLLLSAATHLQEPRTPSIFFEENHGQARAEAQFVARGASYSFAFTPQGNHVALSHSGKRLSFTTTLAGANSNPTITGEEKQIGRANYFRGDRSITDIPTYGRIRYDGIYPGIDLVYYGNQRELEHDFVVRPGGDSNTIALRFDGVEGLALNPQGDLLVQIDGTSLVQQKPVVYQDYGGMRETRKLIGGQYRLISANTVGFDIGPYDHAKALVIDPILSYSTFLGGNGVDDARSIAADSTGSIYITGSTTSPNFFVVGAIQLGPGNQDPTADTRDAFVMKLNASGTALVYAAYLGGADDDVSNKIAVNAAGNAIIAGWTASLSFPTTAGAISRVCGAAGSSCLDAFVAELNPAGSALVYSTYLGGSSDDQARGLAVDSAGNAYITGTTASTNFPVTAGALSTDTTSGGFVTKLSAAGAIVYSTYLGAGPGTTEPAGIAVDSAGNAYIAGTTPSTSATGTDVFLTKLNATGTQSLFTQFLRGVKDEAAGAVALDTSGDAYVTGKTFSVNFPTTSGVVQPAFGGGPLFRSADAATTWNIASAGITRSSLFALAVAPSSPSTIFAGADDDNGGDVFKSTDGGSNWAAVSDGLADARVHAIAVDPTTAATVYAGTRSAGVFKSTNGGASWSPTSMKAGFVSALAVDPVTPATVYAGTETGFYKSTDGGASWTGSTNALAASTIHNLVIDTAAPPNLYAATSTGVYKSSNGGATWVSASSGLFDENVNAVAVMPRNPARLFAATDSYGIFRSLNSGTFWLAANSGIPSSTAGVTVSALTVDPTSGTVYAAVGQSNLSRIYKSLDGVSWVPAGLASARVSAITVNGNSNTITAATVGGSEAFVAKWTASGTLVYSTYLGSYRDDAANAISVDSAGNVVIAGTTSSINFPVANAIQSVFAGGADLVTDAFAAKLNPSASSIVWSTYLGGASDDFGRAVAVDSNDNIYVAGQAGSVNFPTTASAYVVNRPGILNGFLAKIVDNSNSTVAFAVAARGGMSTTSQGGSSNLSVGYAAIQPNTGGAMPSGMAIFGFRQNNVLVTEAAVPASPLISSGRLYAEVSSTLNTGVAMANPNDQPVTVNYYFTDTAGADFGQGSTVIPAGGQSAQFLNQAPFNGGSALLGTFTFTASQPISVVALRGLINERSEFLITTLPVADLSITPGSEAFVFPHYADGGGWTSSLLLVNSTDAPMSGTIQFCDRGGCAGAVQPIASNAYTLPPRSSFQFQTAGAASTVTSGSVRVVPASGSKAPAGVAVFSFKSGGVTVSTAGVPASTTSNAFRMYAELSGTPGQIGSIQTGVAVANHGTGAASVVFELNTLSGASTGLTGSLSIPAGGQTAVFLNQIPGFGTLTTPFKGVLRVSTPSSQGISVIGIRGRYNERADFLITTTQPTDESRPPVGPQFFPHFADGGGYTTQFILFNGGADQASSGALRFFSQSGQLISLAVQ